MSKETVPCWGYRRMEDETVQSKIFHLEEGKDLPSGWVDNPAKCADLEPARPRGRPKKEKAKEEAAAEEE